MNRWKSVLAGLLLLASPGLWAQGAAEPRDMRLFSVAHMHRLDDVTSIASFRAAIREQFEAEIAPHLRADVPNLVAYPENQTLMAYLVGLRGAPGRAVLDSAGAIAALISLAPGYAPQETLALARFPSAAQSPGQLLQLAVTDTLARLAVDTFSALAAEYDVYITISSNLAPFERVDAATAVLWGAAPDASDGFRPADADIRNRNYFFGPDGSLLGVQDKAYLVPIERERTLGLGLLGIETVDLPVLDLPFARVGTVISKDAWMIDVNERLEQINAELLIQPEAFGSWGAPRGDLWPPDKFQRGGWWMLQKHPGLKINVTPMLTGNFGDLDFDGQPFIAVEAPGGDPDLCLMGQRPEYGWAAVGDWSTLEQSPKSLCDEGLRPMLAERARAMLPGSGDALENAYASDVVFADLRLPPRPKLQARPAPATQAAERIERPGDQLLPRLGGEGEALRLAFVDTAGEARQNVAVAAFDGARFSSAAWVAPRAATAYDHFDNQWSGAAIGAGEGSLVGWLDFATENWDVQSATLTGDGQGSAPERVDDAEREAGTLRERGHADLRLLRLKDGSALAIWSDLRWPWVKPQIRLARSEDASRWSPSVRVDGGPLQASDNVLAGRSAGETRGQAHADVVQMDNGRLYAVWQEQDAQGIATIWGASGDASSLRFGPRERLSASAAAYRPRLDASSGVLLVAWEADDGAGGRRIMLRRHEAGRWGPSILVDPSAVAGAVQRYPRPLWIAGQWAVVFEDQRSGFSDVLLARQGRALQRIDDAADTAHARAPDASRLAGSRILVAWQHEDEAGIGLRYRSLSLASSDGSGSAGGLLWLAFFAALLMLRRGLVAPRDDSGPVRRHTSA
ncbi:hypothetical protein [Algiphilus sp.]|uniref:hypothetical protein n=1 Tax=Algiphilus sp. TaxID=1872431 RepID=UPI003B524EEC